MLKHGHPFLGAGRGKENANMKNMEREPHNELAHMAAELSAQFIHRDDLYALQMKNGSYACIKNPYFPVMMEGHLKGHVTLGAYLLDQNSQARFTVLDADDDGQFETLKQIAWGLDSQSIPSYLETSRRGGHLWLFYPQAVLGREARGFGLSLIEGQDIEVYPKQEFINGGPGSLIRVPFGKHKKSGERYPFIHPSGELLGSWEQQIAALSHPETIPLDFVRSHQVEQPKNPMKGTPFDHPVHWLPIEDYIGQHIELRRIPSGYKGCCPFHDDKHASFGINVEGNFWHCFAGCGGGDLISFYMKYNGVDFITAVAELERRYGGYDGG